MPTGDPCPRPDTYEFRCDLWDVDPNRLMEAFLRPLRVLEEEKCVCADPLFDVVTRCGRRHSQFCCACGRPGSDDSESAAC